MSAVGEELLWILTLILIIVAAFELLEYYFKDRKK